MSYNALEPGENVLSPNKIFDIAAFLPPKIDLFVATSETRNSLEIFGLVSEKLELDSNWFCNTRKNSNSKKVGSTTSLINTLCRFGPNVDGNLYWKMNPMWPLFWGVWKLKMALKLAKNSRPKKCGKSSNQHYFHNSISTGRFGPGISCYFPIEMRGDSFRIFNQGYTMLFNTLFPL